MVYTGVYLLSKKGEKEYGISLPSNHGLKIFIPCVQEVYFRGYIKMDKNS